MAKETTQITRYYDAVLPYGSAFKFSERKYESDTDKDHDVSYSKEHFELESSNPADTVKVATFLRNKQYKPNEIIKKDHYYVCEFTWQPHRRIKEYKNSQDITYEGTEITETSHLLFWIYWDDEFSCWQRAPAFACRNASSHNEAGDWMMKEITSEGSEAHDSDYFKNGTLEVIK